MLCNVNRWVHRNRRTHDDLQLAIIVLWQFTYAMLRIKVESGRIRKCTRHGVDVAFVLVNPLWHSHYVTIPASLNCCSRSCYVLDLNQGRTIMYLTGLT